MKKATPTDPNVVPTADQTTPGSIYALLIGINDYVHFNRLRGPLRDLEKVEHYLTTLPGAPVYIKMLKDEEASKNHIVREGFGQFLKQAGPEDSILIYYSGHGAQEEAAAYWDETDEKLECLVCYDESIEKPADFLLADKEINYLIGQLYQATKAHITVVMDCCHSGDNTRAAAFFGPVVVSETRVKAIESDRADGAFDQRKWKDFIFSKNRPKPQSKTEDLSDLFAQERHIQFAACDSFQVALERNGEGVFTKEFLKVLDDANGSLSYENLYSRLSQVMRFAFEQTPRMYASFSGTQWRSEGFLNLPAEGNTSLAELSYNPKKGWQINKGAIHNIQEGTTLKVFRNDATCETVEAAVQQVFIDYAFVAADPRLDKNKVYQVHVDHLLSRKVHLKLNNRHGRPEETAHLIAELERKARGYFTFGPSEEDGQFDYEVHIRNGDFIVTLPDDPYRPLIRPRRFVQSGDVETVVADLIQIAQWHFIKELTNSSSKSSFKMQPVEIRVEQVDDSGVFRELTIENNGFILDFDEKNPDANIALRISLRNLTDRPLYVSCLNMGQYFSSKTDLTQDKVETLEARKTLFLGGDREDFIHYNVDQVTRLYNWKEVREIFQFIVSEELFEVAALSFEGLPKPELPGWTGAELDRGAFIPEMEENTIRIKKWQTYPLTIHAQNAFYNHIRAVDLEAFIQDENTAEFAAGIYYEVQLDDFGQPTQLVLKEEIILVGEEKGLFNDLLIKGANAVETSIRWLRYDKYKNSGRMRIVAEGDSWFQYPLLIQDILDHLYKHYAIRSYAKAGDTLENYMKEKQYEKGVKKENPEFYLVSGGGNDILGEQFQHFLRDRPDPEDPTLRRFLKPNFFAKIEQLGNWYLTMFDKLFSMKPELKILTHSYDYIIPVDTTKTPKKTSWLGKYMIKKGIEPQETREQLIHFIVDEFNRMLISVVNKYPGKVFYIDVRGKTPKEGWHDEIHPKNGDFERIAAEFHKVIEREKVVS